MKRLILGLAITATAANMAAVAAYAAACMSTSGTRYCGSQCATSPSGGCDCTGSCTSEEQQWVKAGGKGSVAEMEMIAY